MLVKKSIVERWYRTDSWVYKNFSYLFSNPIWDKRVPSGFTVCPYFWMSLFSFFIFRPFFVAPLRFLIIPFIKGLGKPAQLLDKGLFFLFKWTGLFGCDYSIGLGFLSTAAASVMFALGGACLYLIIGALIHEYPIFTYAPIGMFVFWSLTSFAALFGIILLHQKISKTECKTMNYLYVWFILFIIATFIFIPGDALHGLGIFFSFIGELLSTIFGAIWFGIKWVGHWLGFGLTYSPGPLRRFWLPIWTYPFIATLIAVLADKILSKLEGYKAGKSTTQDYWVRNRRAWFNLFYRTLMVGDYWKTGDVFKDSWSVFEALGNNPYATQAAYRFQTAIYDEALEIMFGKDLDNLQKQYPLLSGWDDIRAIKDSSIRFAALQTSTKVKFEASFNKDAFIKAIAEACTKPDLKHSINELAAEYKAKDDAKEAKNKAKKTSWGYLTCLRVTTALGDAFGRLGKGIWAIMCQVGTFFAYLWILVKAKKSGACPYFKFTDPDNQ